MDEKEEWTGMSIRFDPVEDADLVDWKNSTPRGQRNELAKKALRLLITGQAVTTPTAEAFDRLRKTVEALARKIDQGVIVQTSQPDRTAIDEAQAARRTDQLLRRKW